jgi:PTS system cellobiose-specific IIC component
MAGWVGPVKVAVPWITPPILNAFMATLDWRAAVLALVNMVIAFFIWVPFVQMSNRVFAKEEAANNSQL